MSEWQEQHRQGSNDEEPQFPEGQITDVMQQQMRAKEHGMPISSALIQPDNVFSAPGDKMTDVQMQQYFFQ